MVKIARNNFNRFSTFEDPLDRTRSLFEEDIYEIKKSLNMKNY